MIKFRVNKDNGLLLSNTSWLVSTEIAAKASRILVLLALAASLDVVDYGTVMLALACYEIVRQILRSGAGAQVIQCKDNVLKRYAQNAAFLQWLVCVVVMLVQIVVALAVADFYQNPTISHILFFIAPTFLLYPIVSVNIFLLHRAKNMRYFSIRNGLCIVVENLSISAFALADFGVDSVIYGKWVFALTWVALFYAPPVPKFSVAFDISTLKELVHTSGQLVSTETVRAIRQHMDVFIAGRLLTPELFGLYAFAKSAGVGLSQSIVFAFNSALYPHLCQLNRQNQLASGSLKIYAIALAVGMIFVVQSLLAPFYVPLLFDQSWQQNYTLVSIMCLIALPTILVDTHCNILRAKGRFKDELMCRIYCLAISAVGLLLLQPQTSESFAKCLLLSSAAWLITVIHWPGLLPKSKCNSVIPIKEGPK